MMERPRINIIFVDYARISSGEQKKKVPARYAGKFVQIKNKSTEYLVFSPKDYMKYHADIVQRFCMDHEIPGVYDKKQKRFDIIDYAWSVVGGGKFEINKKKKTLRLYEDSMVYGRYDRRGMKEKILSIKEFTGFELDVE